ncbi:MAG: DUF2938 family protein [Geminicoccaceae bacterium]|nr:DUF2938 family protein [Geminicoccaceae bacterium]MCB9943113.1 DUF2938 family protein [Geminicoccaceae bacterium]
MIEAIMSGVVATLFLDAWQRILRLAAGIPVSNWALVGRWFAHLPQGRMFHDPITEAKPVDHELAIGWIGHYVTGIAYGFIYLWVIRDLLGLEPTILNGLVFGAISVLVPWFFFMPAMGGGLLGRNTPNPPKACVLAFMTHCVFGVGLATGALVV